MYFFTLLSEIFYRLVASSTQLPSSTTLNSATPSGIVLRYVVAVLRTISMQGFTAKQWSMLIMNRSEVRLQRSEITVKLTFATVLK